MFLIPAHSSRFCSNIIDPVRENEQKFFEQHPKWFKYNNWEKARKYKLGKLRVFESEKLEKVFLLNIPYKRTLYVVPIS